MMVPFSSWKTRIFEDLVCADSTLLECTAARNLILISGYQFKKNKNKNEIDYLPAEMAKAAHNTTTEAILAMAVIVTLLCTDRALIFAYIPNSKATLIHLTPLINYP